MHGAAVGKVDEDRCGGWLDMSAGSAGHDVMASGTAVHNGVSTGISRLREMIVTGK